jgi:hypothetical protein
MRSMTRKMVAVLAAMGGLAAPLAAQLSFEGVIEFQGGFKGTENGSTMVQTTKGHMMRIDMTETRNGQPEQNSMIADLDTRMITMVIAERHQYMVMPMHVPQASKSSTSSHDYGKVSLEKTGRTETVAGVKCDIYHGTNTTPQGKVTQGEACLAKGVGFAMFDVFASSRSAAQSDNPTVKIFRKLAEQDLQVLKMYEEKDGKMVPVLWATKIERMSVPNSAFAPPAGYTKLEIPSMMNKPPKP